MKNHLVGLIVLIFSVNKHAPAGFLVENVLEWRARLVCPECGTRLDPARTAFDKLTASEWEELFEKQNTPPPQPIDTGDDIVFWYSADVSSEVTIPGQSKTPFWAADGGTVFLHGFFFAHDAEQTGSLVGSTNARYWPRSAAKIHQDKKWFRQAS